MIRDYLEFLLVIAVRLYSVYVSNSTGTFENWNSPISWYTPPALIARMAANPGRVRLALRAHLIAAV